MVEKSNKTIEDTLLKCMVNQDEWDEHLDSVLFSIRVHKHSSTGMSPFRMMFNRDPIMPFQYKDRLEQYPESLPEDCFNIESQSNNNSIDQMVSELEIERSSIFQKAGVNIKKAQKVQERNYNKRHQGSNTLPILPNDMVMKINLAQKNRKAKMKNAHLGPYSVVSVTDKGYYLKDKYSHYLKRPVPAVQLVRYYGTMPIVSQLSNLTSKGTDSTDTDSDVNEISQTQSSTNSEFVSPGDVSSESEKEVTFTMSSQRCRSRLSRKRKVKNISLPQGQVLISKGIDQCLSSDDSILIDIISSPKKRKVEISDIGNEYDLDNLVQPPDAPFVNPFGDTNVDDIPLEIIPSPTIFQPLTEKEIILAGMKLGIRIERSYTSARFTGIGKPFLTDPVVTIAAKGNGGCLPNCFSLLLSGCDLYGFMIRNAICNYIQDPSNIADLRQHIPTQYKTGRDYIVQTGRRRNTSWCTEVEIFAFAQLTGFDVLVYSTSHKWLMYTKDSCGIRTTDTAFYINNVSGCHFDPVFTTEEYL